MIEHNTTVNRTFDNKSSDSGTDDNQVLLNFALNGGGSDFVFQAQWGNGNEKYTAEAISQEAGYMLGLTHDGRLSPPEEYFLG